MRPIKIEFQPDQQSYPIMIGHGILSELAAEIKRQNIGTDAVIVTNPVIHQHHGAELSSALRDAGFGVGFLDVPSGESSKSAECAFDLIRRIAEEYAGKNVFIIAFGGGVVGDLAGYVAAAYRRGIPYVQVPTTLLAQIDSAMGGKVAVDLPFGKNLVGAFYHPRLVYTDVDLLRTLDLRQIRNGLSEAVKYGVICDKNLFAFIEANADALLRLEQKPLTETVYLCSRIKASIVSRDERESQGLRTILNFGHTIGHAVEASSAYEPYQHGEAVALGMRAAAEISLLCGMIPEDDARRLNDLLTRLGLPEKIKGMPLDTLLEPMRHDKKFHTGRNRFVLMNALGSVKIVEDVPEEAIRRAVSKYLQQPGEDAGTLF
ncbi:MAG: 3-dehydroquinate synthase [Candidatus Omnitrophota bacterium]